MNTFCRYYNNWRGSTRGDDRAAAGKLCEEHGVRLLTVVVASRGLLTLGVLKHYVKVRQVKEAEHLKV